MPIYNYKIKMIDHGDLYLAMKKYQQKIDNKQKRELKFLDKKINWFKRLIYFIQDTTIFKP